MDEQRQDELTAQSFEITHDQDRWLSRAAERSGESRDALVRQALQMLRRLAAYRDPRPSTRRFD